MILSVLLSCFFIFMAYCTVVLTRSGAFRAALLFFYGLAIVSVWFPAFSTTIANFFGIGRGLDLIFILLSVLLLTLVFFTLFQIHNLQKKLTLVARHIALSEAVIPREPYTAAQIDVGANNAIHR